jgi:hypothetical protein
LNFKSNMLKILVVFALILMIIPAIAAEDTAQDDEAAADSDDAVLTESGADDSSETSTDTDDELEAEDATELEEGQAAGEPAAAVGALVPAPSGFMMDLPAADLAVKVTPEYQTAQAGDLVVWATDFVNFGPDVAEDVIGQVGLLQGNIAFYDAFATYFNALNGMTEPVSIPNDYLALIFDPITGIINLGDMAPGDVITLYIAGVALDDGQAIFAASIHSDTTYDPNPSNNVDFGYVNYAGEAAAAEETLPAAGNPIAMALLALISIVGLTFGRRL